MTASFSRITPTQALKLLADTPLLELGHMANQRRQAVTDPTVVTFVIDRNINYSNICSCQCSFCAFYRHQDSPDAYWLSRQEFAQKIAETVDAGGNQILLQGGLHPEKTIEDYEQMLRQIKEDFPEVHIHAFGAPEVHHIAAISGMSTQQCLQRLKQAGLGTIPGGGAEILVDRVRQRISPNKIGATGWIETMQEAHRQGIRTTATMMFGTGESSEDLIEHLDRIRQAQDETGGFTAFIPWTYQPDYTELYEQQGRQLQKKTSHEYLRVLALSRIYLDNIPNIQVSWVTQGDKAAQVALNFGANDYGSLMLEENVVKSAGVSFRMSLDQLVHTIRNAGFRAMERNVYYEPLREHTT
ncbi:cyclic dehypoxanthinyl futalosine synthase [Desulfurispira natronophila]|uniref:Cyclic dehypoxanthine futalosine synthase n=1 Tax=Desulfurispira natronophila TaxID=682562 RepID=A0A7W8DH42_9BACT|nr:cyclic dehypoxanthinyl futalosine synthase [Desulfurispira natronophila]MBB5021992.1 cyclic dehypoxanthinyl futalosine synthase [Desulfurispira natronophila]